MIKDILDNNETISVNEREISVLKEYFPACFSEDGSFDLERFKEYINDRVDVKSEGYELKFLGKNYARLLASIDTTTVIKPNEEHNKKPENKNSENLYITGDNLDGLKHLLKSYAGKIKCIYIDPPYNTGSDGFVYCDRFDFTVDDLKTKLSISESQAQRILDLTKRGSASHSAWLMFMYPRLQLARDLLSDDGVIFISIDDNEQANLKLICDDVFGEENFIALLIWEKKKKGSYLATGITNIKEYVLTYSRNTSKFNGLIGEINSNTETYPCVNATNRREIRVIPPGIRSNYSERDFFLKAGETISDTTMNLLLCSDLVIQNGLLKEELIIEGNWRYNQKAMTEYALNRELYITRDLYLRRIVTEPRYKGLKDLLLRVGDDPDLAYSYNYDVNNLYESGWGSNEDADEEQRVLFGVQSLMSYPKPLLLIMKLLASTRMNDMIVLDFFSGSATTAEAVLRNNIKGMNLKFIVVQIAEDLNEALKKATGEEKNNISNLISFLQDADRPPTLEQLGIERIIRAAKKIKEEYPDTTADLGFKHYVLEEPTGKQLDDIIDFDRNLNEIIVTNNIVEEFGTDTVLTTWLVRDGYGFSPRVNTIDFGGYKGYHIDKHLYLIDKGLDRSTIEAIVTKLDTDPAFNPENIVLFGYSFTWTELESLQTNLKRFKATEKNLRINFDIRY